MSNDIDSSITLINNKIIIIGNLNVLLILHVILSFLRKKGLKILQKLTERELHINVIR